MLSSLSRFASVAALSGSFADNLCFEGGKHLETTVNLINPWTFEFILGRKVLKLCLRDLKISFARVDPRRLASALNLVNLFKFMQKCRRCWLRPFFFSLTFPFDEEIYAK